jgi:hypothetical protein
MQDMQSGPDQTEQTSPQSLGDTPGVAAGAEAVVAQPAPTAWGFIENGLFIEIPKRPLQLANMGPPCSVKMYNGSIREIIERVAPEAHNGSEGVVS